MGPGARHAFQNIAVSKTRDIHRHAFCLAEAKGMFTVRIGIRQSIVERSIFGININPAHADWPAHDLSVPAVIIRIVSS